MLGMGPPRPGTQTYSPAQQRRTTTVAPMDGPIDRYGSIARFYDTVIEPINAPLARRARQMHPLGHGASVLDVGCGTGIHLEEFAKAGAACHGVDLSIAMLTRAENRLADGANLLVASGLALPHRDRVFDLVLGSLLLHELTPEDRTQVIAEMLRVVAADGRVLIIDYRVGRLRLKGRAWRGITTAIERLAGVEHFRQWRCVPRRGRSARSTPGRREHRTGEGGGWRQPRPVAHPTLAGAVTHPTCS